MVSCRRGKHFVPGAFSLSRALGAPLFAPLRRRALLSLTFSTAPSFLCRYDEDGDAAEGLVPASDGAAALLDAAARTAAFERLLLAAEAQPVDAAAAPADGGAAAFPESLVRQRLAAELRRSGGGGGEDGGTGSGQQQDEQQVEQQQQRGDADAAAADMPPLIGVVRLTLTMGPLRVQQLCERALNTWRPGAAPALVWRSILPAQLSPADAAAAAAALLRDGDAPRFASEHEAAQHYSLLGCFQELPSLTAAAYADPTMPPVRGGGGGGGGSGAQNGGSSGTSSSGGGGAQVDEGAASSGSTIADIPDEALANILARLPPADLARAAASCSLLRRANFGAVPGLRLTLYPHQRRALRWMLSREAPPRDAAPEHPFVRTLVTAPGGLACYVNAATGALSFEAPERPADVRGGFFCDEPVRARSSLPSLYCRPRSSSLPC